MRFGPVAVRADAFSWRGPPRAKKGMTWCACIPLQRRPSDFKGEEDGPDVSTVKAQRREVGRIHPMLA